MNGRLCCPAACLPGLLQPTRLVAKLLLPVAVVVVIRGLNLSLTAKSGSKCVTPS